MPSWKKIILSGSNAILSSINNDSTVSATNITGSFTGSFSGDGSDLTGVSAFPFTGDAVISGSLEITGSGGLKVKGPIEVSMTASSGVIPLSIKTISDLSTDTLIQIRDDGGSFDLMTFDSEGRFNMRGTSTDSEGAGYYASQGGVVKEHVKMGFTNGKAQLSLSTNSADRFKVWLNSSNTSPMVGLEGRGTIALGTAVSAATLPNEARTNTMFIKTGTAPSTAEADNIQFFAQDVNSVAGTASPTFLTEDGQVLQIGVTSSLSYVSASAFKGDGSQLTNLPSSDPFPFTGDARITGSLNVSGSTTIEIPTGDAFTILEGDKDQQSRLIFDYTNGDPTLTIASRASTATIHIRPDASQGLRLNEDGQIYMNNSISDGVQINGSAFFSIGTNANALDLGSTTRPWNDIYLRSTAGVIIDGGTSAQFLKADGSVDSTAYTTNTGTLTGNGTSTRVAFYTGTTSLTTNSGFVYIEGSKQLQLTGDSTNAPLRISNLTAGSEITTALVVDEENSNDIKKVTLGSNAFTSTTIPTNTSQLTNGAGFLTSLSGAILTSGNQTATGVKTFSGAISSSAGIYLPTGANVGSFASDWNMIGDRPKIKVAQNLAIYNQNNQQMAIFGSNFSSVISGSLTVGGSSDLGPNSPILDGRIDAKNDVVAFSTSDKRLKDNITPIDSALDKISKIQGIEFDWIPAPGVHGNEGHDVGVIAQEIEEVLPEVVNTRDNGYKAVKYEKIVPLLIESIKELKSEIEELKRGK